jgi:hypothetical protein
MSETPSPDVVTVRIADLLTMQAASACLPMLVAQVDRVYDAFNAAIAASKMPFGQGVEFFRIDAGVRRWMYPADRALFAYGLALAITVDAELRSLIRPEYVDAWCDVEYVTSVMHGIFAGTFDVTYPPSTPDEIHKHCTSSVVTIPGIGWIALRARLAVMETLTAPDDADAWGNLYDKHTDIRGAVAACIDAQRSEALAEKADGVMHCIGIACFARSGDTRGVGPVHVVDAFTDDEYFSDLLASAQRGTFDVGLPAILPDDIQAQIDDAMRGGGASA